MTMNRPSNEEIAGLIEKAALAVPSMPTEFDAPYLPYLRARIEDVRSFWRAQGIEPEHLTVMGGTALMKAFAPLREYDGISIDYVVNPISDYASKDGLDEGSFTLEFSAFHPVSSWVKPAFGIAFSGPVTPELFATRWTLQEIDGMDAVDAARASEIL